MIKYAFAAAALLAVQAAVPAHAEPVSRSVSFAGLDLGTEAGQSALRYRVKAAIRQMCGDADPRDLAAQREQARCRRVATKDAGASVQQAITVHSDIRLADRRDLHR